MVQADLELIYAAQRGLEVTVILLSQAPKCWNHRDPSSHLNRTITFQTAERVRMQVERLVRKLLSYHGRKMASQSRGMAMENGEMFVFCEL